MKRLLTTFGAGLANTLLAGGLAALGCLALIVEAGGGNPSATPCGIAEDYAGRVLPYLGTWVVGLASPGWGESWDCRPLAAYLGPILTSLTLVGMALGASIALAVALVWREYRIHLAPKTAPLVAPALFMAPPVLWAAVLTVFVNLTVLLAAARLVALDTSRWLLPGSVDGIRWGASVVVLCLGAGTFWDLYRGLRSDLLQLMRREFVLMAQVNGMKVGAHLRRNLLIPFGTRVVSKVPLLLGEVIVVEYFFQIEGAGAILLQRLELRDAPVVMLIALFFVGLTVALRWSVRVMSIALTPLAPGRSL